MNRTFFMNMIRTAAMAAISAIPGMCCNYSVSVPAIGASGGVVAVYVNTSPGCSWQISHTGSFLSYYGGRTGSGPGVAYMYAAPDYGATRSAAVYVLQPYSYQCGMGGRNIQWCTGWSNAAGTTAVQY